MKVMFHGRHPIGGMSFALGKVALGSKVNQKKSNFEEHIWHSDEANKNVSNEELQFIGVAKSRPLPRSVQISFPKRKNKGGSSNDTRCASLERPCYDPHEGRGHNPAMYLLTGSDKTKRASLGCYTGPDFIFWLNRQHPRTCCWHSTPIYAKIFDIQVHMKDNQRWLVGIVGQGSRVMCCMIIGLIFGKNPLNKTISYILLTKNSRNKLIDFGESVKLLAC
ncbi:hypothetical protein Cgig2_015780 [Carnegiea gigantea]|uniref:Uncharacterized protein n=1 Tax=Carnegiea gigantea TaxID=171969 RepID=A0A9Q1KHF8_9CARY|nr:hypothetical protein Cgig2_015780 [Carnegiea gigantea]